MPSTSFLGDNEYVVIESDRNATGVGDTIFKTGGVERARITANGTGTGWATVLGGALPLNVADVAYGAVADGLTFADGAITHATTTLTSASATFTKADIGKTMYVQGAGTAGADLKTKIARFNSATSVELTDAAGTDVAAATYIYGTLSTTAFQACAAASFAQQVPMWVPMSPLGGSAYYLFDAPVTLKSGASIQGPGFQGNGPQLAYIGADTTHAIQDAVTGGGTGNSRLKASGFRLTDFRTGMTAGDGIHFHTTNGSIVEDAISTKFPTSGIYVGNANSASNNDNYVVRNVWAQGALYGVTVDSMVENCILQDIKGDSSTTANTDCLIRLTGSAGGGMSNVIIQGAKMEVGTGLTGRATVHVASTFVGTVDASGIFVGGTGTGVAVLNDSASAAINMRAVGSPNTQVLVSDTVSGKTWGNNASLRQIGQLALVRGPMISPGSQEIAVRSADSTAVNNSTVLVSDDTLFFWIKGDSTGQYLVEGLLMFSGDATMDVKVAFAGPTGFGGSWGGVGAPQSIGGWGALSASSTVNAPVGPTSAIGFAGAAGVAGIYIAAIITAGSGDGNVILQWAQNTAEIANLILKKGSMLRVTKLF